MNNKVSPAESLHVITYDVRGVFEDCGEIKQTRETGLVSQTHHLIGGLASKNPDLTVSVTQTGSDCSPIRRLRLPEGISVDHQSIKTDFPEHLRTPGSAGKSRHLVSKYYEQMIDKPENPVYLSLAMQYAQAIHDARSPNLLLQNANPVTSLLKSEELGHLDEITSGQLNATGIIHDIETYESRLRYVAERLQHTNINLKLIAVSTFVCNQLVELGIGPEHLTMVSNGIDVDKYMNSIERVGSTHIFKNVVKRNNLPEDKKMIILPARRVPHKGHLDVIDAAKILNENNDLDDIYIAISGSKMLDTRSLDYEESIKADIKLKGLEGRVFLLDELNEDETVACISNSMISVLPSTEPEGFAYANIEAMLSGVPVITTRMGGPMDYVRDMETGLFVSVNRPDQIANAIKMLKQNPILYAKISENAKSEARKYTINAMVEGYEKVIRSGSQKLPFRISFNRPFKKIGEGMNSKVYRRANEKYVIQQFKPEAEISLKSIPMEYNYLIEAFSELPRLIPEQRLVLPSHHTDSITECLLIKQDIRSNPERNTLLKVGPDELENHTLEQLEAFVRITKSLFTYESINPELRVLGSMVPDIIDPEFENLLIDLEGNLRLVDTNRLISTRHLIELVKTGSKLDVEKKIIHSLLLRRLIFIDQKFFNKSNSEVIADPFYAQFLSIEGFKYLFNQIGQAKEYAH